MGEIVRRGIDAYQQTMGIKKEPSADVKPEGLQKQTIEKKAPEVKETKIRRVAKFLILVGTDRAAEILSELDQNQIDEISREIASIKVIGKEEADAILQEFQSLLGGSSPYQRVSFGGQEAARKILYAAYGPEKGEALLNKAVPESKESIFGFLKDLSSMQISMLLKDESPEAIALVLSRLPPKTIVDTLGHFPPEVKRQVVKKIARKTQVMPLVLEQVAGAIREKARRFWSADNMQAASQEISIDGMKALTAILKHGDYSLGDRIISELEYEDPKIGKEIKDRLFTLDDILDVYDRPLAEKLKTMTDKAIALLLKGRSEIFCKKILSNVSSGRREVIREEGEIMGAVLKRDCDEAAKEFIAWFRRAREKGSLLLTSDEDWV